MLDISRKTDTLRCATAEAILKAAPETIRQLQERQIPKGDALEIARVAAILAAKNTSQIIPFCHPKPVEHVTIEFNLVSCRIPSTVTIKSTYETVIKVEVKRND